MGISFVEVFMWKCFVEINSLFVTHKFNRSTGPSFTYPYLNVFFGSRKMQNETICKSCYQRPKWLNFV